MLLNNEWVKNEIKEETKKFLETNANELTTIQNLWNTAKAVLTGEFIMILAYLKKIETLKKKKKKKKPNPMPTRPGGTTTKTVQSK